jgi:hypothetical protein
VFAALRSHTASLRTVLSPHCSAWVFHHRWRSTNFIGIPPQNNASAWLSTRSSSKTGCTVRHTPHLSDLDLLTLLCAFLFVVRTCTCACALMESPQNTGVVREASKSYRKKKEGGHHEKQREKDEKGAANKQTKQVHGPCSEHGAARMQRHAYVRYVRWASHIWQRHSSFSTPRHARSPSSAYGNTEVHGFIG